MSDIANKTRFLILLLWTLVISCSAEEILNGPKFLEAGRYYTAGGNQFYFVHSKMSGDIDDRFRASMVGFKERSIGSHVVNDTFWNILPEIDGGTGDATDLLLGWWNARTEKFGWVRIWNSRDTWRYRTNSGSSSNISNATGTTLSWSDQGQPIKIYIYNPPNRNGWTADHIQYRFYLPHS